MTSVSSVDGQGILNNYISSQKEAATKTTETDSTSSLFSSYDTFLKILTTQLKNQDPTAPMDASEFTQQLVQYAEVEQQLATNDKLDSVLSSINSNGITPLMNYVGAYVEMPSDGKLVVQGGQAVVGYTLPETALSTTLYVKDKDGDVVATVGGTTTKGLNRIVWDGKLDDGTTAPNGVYSFSITAKNSKGEAMSLDDIRVVGYVTGIETETDGTISLKAGDLSIKDTAVTSVFAYINAAKGDSAGATDETEDTAEDTTTTTDDSTG